MKKCKHCQSEIDAKAKICPNCKKKQGMPIWLIIILIIVVIGIIGVALDEGDKSTSGDNTSSKKTTKTTKKFTLEDNHTGSLGDMGYAYYVEGYVKNNKDKEYSYVQITFTTYDSDGNTLGTCIDNNSGLEANSRWKFKAMCLDDTENIASYKLKEITGY